MRLIKTHRGIIAWLAGITFFVGPLIHDPLLAIYTMAGAFGVLIWAVR